MDGWVNRYIDGWMEGWMNDRQMDKSDELIDGWIDGWMDGWMMDRWYEWLDKWRKLQKAGTSSLSSELEVHLAFD